MDSSWGQGHFLPFLLSAQKCLANTSWVTVACLHTETQRIEPFIRTAAAIHGIRDDPGTMINALHTSSPSVLKSPSEMTEFSLCHRWRNLSSLPQGHTSVSGRTGTWNETFLRLRWARTAGALSVGFEYGFIPLQVWMASAVLFCLSQHQQFLKPDIYLMLTPFWHLLLFWLV